MLVSRDRCPVCRSADAEDLFCGGYSEGPVYDYLNRYYKLEKRNLLDQYYSLVGDGTYDLKSCTDCSLIYQVSYPDEAFSQIIYSQWITPPQIPNDDVTGIGFEDAKHYTTEALKLTGLMLRLTGKTRPGQLRVVDYGMGRGGFALALKACGCDVYAYDFSEERQALGARLGITMIGPNDLGGEDFDFINTEQVFEHLPDPSSTAESLASALRPGGVLKISVPFNKWLDKGDMAVDWTAGRYDKHSPIPNAPLEHLQYYRRPSLERLGKSVGLEPVTLTAGEHLNHSLDWLHPKKAATNMGRAFALERFRNYKLLQK